MNVALESAFADPGLSIRKLAHTVGLSERQFQRRVLDETGKSPAAYLREFRLSRACKYLRDGRAICDVAHAAGFTSHAYFSHCFRAHFGITPTEYRNDGALRLDAVAPDPAD